MDILPGQLREIMPALTAAGADQWTTHLNEAMSRFHIDTRLRQAHFLAQVAHESGQLRILKENLNYSETGLLKTFPKYFNERLAKEYAHKPERIASRVYANRLGNGHEASGEGFNYRGRGPIQITGKTNYINYSHDVYGDNRAVDNPDMLMLYSDGAKSAAWFWDRANLNEVADKDSVEQVTKRINGGYNGLDDRKKFLATAKQALGV